MRFTKMQGLGNDYIYLDCLEQSPDDLPKLAVRLSDRHFGIGADGLICVFPSAVADARMRIFNADGSEGEMCGNGIRCVGKFLWDKQLVQKRHIAIETLAGVKQLSLLDGCGQTMSITVDMGVPVIEPPCALEIDGALYPVTPISMGNPHAVYMCREVGQLDLERLGPLFEHHVRFPERVNTEFVQVVDRTLLSMRVWERGSGETLACGTGACAAVVAGVTSGDCNRRADVRLRGGTLEINWNETDGHVYMTGPAETVFEGDV